MICSECANAIRDEDKPLDIIDRLEEFRFELVISLPIASYSCRSRPRVCCDTRGSWRYIAMVITAIISLVASDTHEPRGHEAPALHFQEQDLLFTRVDKGAS